MPDNLVKRLREAFVDFDDLHDAAARIEELEAKLAVAVEALERSAQEHRTIASMDMICASATAYNAARDAEATLAELTGGKDE